MTSTTPPYLPSARASPHAPSVALTVRALSLAFRTPLCSFRHVS